MLTDTDLRRFAADGYLVVRGVVPESLLERADAEIDAMIGSEAPMYGAGCFGWTTWTFGPRQVPECDEVLRSCVLQVAEELVAPHRLDLRANEIQVAVTVPPSPEDHGVPHIDGHRPEQDPPHTFTILTGVFLTDQPVAGSGNLWVWPGSHLSNARLSRERGWRILRQTSGDVDFLSSLVGLPPPVPITGTRGDLVLAHFLLQHATGGNMTIHDRRTLYFRLAVPGHEQWWDRTLSDEWFEYPDVRRAARTLDS